MGTFFKLGKDKAAKGEGWAPPSTSFAQDAVGLTPHSPYGYKAMGNLYLYLSVQILSHCKRVPGLNGIGLFCTIAIGLKFSFSFCQACIVW